MLHTADCQKNTNQNNNEVSPHTSQNDHHQSLQIMNGGEGVEKKELSYTVPGNASWCSHYGKQYGGSLKTNNRPSHDPVIPPLGAYPEELKTDLKEISAHSHLLQHYSQQPRDEKPQCISMDKWIRKMSPAKGCTIQP